MRLADGGDAMNLSAADQQVLRSIEAEFAGSDPKLTSMLGTFTRLAADEDMPESEQLPARHRRIAGGLRSTIRAPRRAIRWPRRPWAGMGIWVVATLALIAVVAAVTHGGYAPCEQ